MAVLARELDARGRARGKTLDLAAEREKRRGRVGRTAETLAVLIPRAPGREQC